MPIFVYLVFNVSLNITAPLSATLLADKFIADPALFWAGLKVKIFPSSPLKFKTGALKFKNELRSKGNIFTFLKNNQLKKVQAQQ
jgi:hypothetical protein